MKKREHRFFNSIIARIFFGILLVVLPINILVIVTAQLFYESSKQQSYQESVHALSLYMQQLDSQLDQSLYYLHNEAETVNYMKLLRPDRSSSKKEYEYFRASTLHQNKLKEMLDVNPLLDGGYAFFQDGDVRVVYTNISKEAESIIEYAIEYVRIQKEMENQYYSLGWEPVEIEGTFYLLLLGNKMDSCYGAWINLDQLIRKMMLDVEKVEDRSFFQDSQGKILTGIDIDSKQLQSYQHISVSSEKSSIQLVKMISRNRLVESIPRIARIMQAFSIIGLMSIPMIVLILKLQVFNPVLKLLKAIKQINTGELEHRIEEQHTTSEFHEINASFNRMMDQIKNLKIDVYESELSKQRIRLEYLSHQVQPHFILNSLNIIYSYEKEEYPLIQDMIVNLIHYFRYIVRVNASYVPLKQELEHIENYLNIQSIRYPEAFQSKVICEEALKMCLIPPLIVQNFVENAFKNAFDIDEKFEIIVKVSEWEGNRLKITIEDNGKGFKKEVLEALERFRETKTLQAELGVGIQNTIERLAILYHDISWIEFANREEGGAAVSIFVPKYYLEEMEDDV